MGKTRTWLMRGQRILRVSAGDRFLENKKVGVGLKPEWQIAYALKEKWGETKVGGQKEIAPKRGEITEIEINLSLLNKARTLFKEKAKDC